MKNAMEMSTKQAPAFGPAYQTSSPWETRYRHVPERTMIIPAPITDVSIIQSEHESEPFVTLLLKIFSLEHSNLPTNETLFTGERMTKIHLVTRQESNHDEIVSTYQFQFHTRFAHQDSILQSFLGVIQESLEDIHEVRQTYTVTRVDHRLPGKDVKTVLGTGLVFPAQHDFCELENGHRAFVGQRHVKSDPYIDSLFESYSTYHHTRMTAKKENQFLLMILQIPQFVFGDDHTLVDVYSTQPDGNRRHPPMFASQEHHVSHFNPQDR